MNEILPDSDIRFLKGVGEKRAAAFYSLGVRTVNDLLSHYPRAYEDRTAVKKIIECENNETVCIKATVSSALHKNIVRKNMTVYTLRVSDGTGFMDMVWFNMRFLEGKFKTGDTFIFYGKVQTSPKKQMQSPIYEKPECQSQTGRIIPVYPLANGLTQNLVRTSVEHALSQTAGRLSETLPEFLRLTYNLCELNFAIQNIHFPANQEAYEAARKRFVFEELFYLQTALFSLKDRRSNEQTIPFEDTACVASFLSALPFALTGAQNRVVSEICADLGRGKPMNRLVQGDVGSGKTVVAAAAMYVAAQNGFQSAMMAPTEILAGQHYENLRGLFQPFGVEVELLTGSMGTKAKRETLERLASGASSIVVGTHALISEDVSFQKLGLVITDEQHRFGVNQRRLLSDKGSNPHTLVMTATPIPRTLALIVYGDLDISAIDELPPGRKKVDTFVVGESMRTRIQAFIRKEINAGHQAYIVCPLVEDSPQMDLKSVTEYASHLQKNIFPDLPVAFLHGKMKPSEKEDIMARFAAGVIPILVATSVIEVGVNVPNASVMVIENAERFGLSQLHQLRGRVGRGSDKAYCILFCQSRQEATLERMNIMRQTNDGFKIAEKDLELRGPGEFFGTRQHGLPPLKIANLYCDMDILKQTTEAARNLLASDPEFLHPENSGIKQKIAALLRSNITFS